ncbi:hypothetical protein [Pedobacter frigidisoli]|uniref:hypothetical protein n=1 Tax=Pedobacter frigidisoli TaxID=2530455 RepID=UPI0029309ECD|nr:hypothetical protein [Pedobacter frigidisoli]
MSIPFRLIVASMLMVCAATSVFAETGCLVPPAGSAGRSAVDLIYSTPQPGETPGKFYTNDNPYRLNCSSGAASSTTYATNVTDVPGAGCWVEYKGGGTQYPNNYYQNGRVVNFSIQQCPIDDYMPIIFVGLGGFGYFIVRRSNLA